MPHQVLGDVESLPWLSAPASPCPAGQRQRTSSDVHTMGGPAKDTDIPQAGRPGSGHSRRSFFLAQGGDHGRHWPVAGQWTLHWSPGRKLRGQSGHANNARVSERMEREAIVPGVMGWSLNFLCPLLQFQSGSVTLCALRAGSHACCYWIKQHLYFNVSGVSPATPRQVRNLTSVA